MRWALKIGARYLYHRAQEVSTWRGIILSVGGAYAASHPELIDLWIPVLLAVVGALGAMFPDVVGPTESPQITQISTDSGSSEGEKAVLPSVFNRRESAQSADRRPVAADRVRQPLPPQPDSRFGDQWPGSDPDHSNGSGWNG